MKEEQYFAQELFCDGGVIGRNPSQDGGTWAWVRTEHGLTVEKNSGILTPEIARNPIISNNNTELYALCMGILSLPPNWTGRVNSDSQIALGWIFQAWKVTSIPPFFMMELLDTLEWIKQENGYAWRLLGGHPTKRDLEYGIRERSPRLPVSKFNVWCDQECARLSVEFKALKAEAA